MLSSILDDLKREGCRESSARVRGVGKYKRNGVCKGNEGGKYDVKRKINFVNLFLDEN